MENVKKAQESTVKIPRNIYVFCHNFVNIKYFKTYCVRINPLKVGLWYIKYNISLFLRF